MMITKQSTKMIKFWFNYCCAGWWGSVGLTDGFPSPSQCRSNHSSETTSRWYPTSSSLLAPPCPFRGRTLSPSSSPLWLGCKLAQRWWHCEAPAWWWSLLSLSSPCGRKGTSWWSTQRRTVLTFFHAFLPYWWGRFLIRVGLSHGSLAAGCLCISIVVRGP